MKKALIIDDNADNLKILSQLLVLAGVSYTAIQDPTTILEKPGLLNNVDIVFLDLEMPRLNGYELFPIIRDQIGVLIPIVACTIYTNEIDVARDIGFHSFLGKPLQADRFADQIHRILNGEPVWDLGGITG